MKSALNLFLCSYVLSFSTPPPSLCYQEYARQNLNSLSSTFVNFPIAVILYFILNIRFSRGGGVIFWPITSTVFFRYQCNVVGDFPERVSAALINRFRWFFFNRLPEGNQLYNINVKRGVFVERARESMWLKETKYVNVI